MNQKVMYRANAVSIKVREVSAIENLEKDTVTLLPAGITEPATGRLYCYRNTFAEAKLWLIQRKLLELNKASEVELSGTENKKED